MTKTFVDGEVLTAADVNNELNPTTAPHIPYAVATGRINASTKTGAVYTHPITFPTGRFTQPPIIQVTINTASSGTNNVQVSTGAVTTTGCNVYFWGINGSLNNAYCVADWTAIQMTPQSATG